MKKKWKVLVTREIPQVGIDILKTCCELDLNTKGRKLTKGEIIDSLRGKQALCCMGDDLIDAEVIQSQPNLKIIANYSVGCDNIDIGAATQREVLVTNVSGVLTEAVAEMTWCLLLCIARRAIEADNFVRSGQFKGTDPNLFVGTQVGGKILGIVGAGRIGLEVARRAQAFNVRIFYSDLIEREEMNELNSRRVVLDELLKESDFVSLHVPLTAETRHLIGERELKLMKNTAYLVNIARGAIVDETALVRALKHSQIAGAALDVYENEPALIEGLSDLQNVVLTPHIGSATQETRKKMATVIAENCIAGLKGERPTNLVNPEVI